MLKSRSRILITLGDPAGVGHEVTAAALLRAGIPELASFILIGNKDVFSRYWPQGKSLPQFLHVEPRLGVVHEPGKPSSHSGFDSLQYLEHAVGMLQKGEADALVTAPVSKELIAEYIPGFKGHTTYLANAFARPNVEMVFVADDLKMVLVTRHIPLKDVASAVTKDKVLAVIRSTHSFLVQRFGLQSPKIAVCGLNPHAGEGGHIGREEVEHIIPALEEAKKSGINVAGPFPADTLFEPRNLKGYDLVVSMYHDQGLPLLKAQYFDRLVNLSVGLPFVRTSPAHGTAFGIAGKGLADPGSMAASICLAAKLI
ncbi:MAG: 4-hydroxythreonine-4-phosphate dehydrogenase PdxA [Candidatus Omnitrophica bacterium]|nr:4-hydroxythreonine-4-phosphate dehydrogenase PdxA [Candidatus Omnitrophota bacterium]